MKQPRIIGGRYEILSLLGQGGIATVYKGLDKETDETVAVKVLKAEVTDTAPEMVQRFVNEGEALRRLNHPNIVKVLDSLEEEGQHYVIMEYVSGGDLRDYAAKHERLPVQQVLEIALDLSDALIRAHRLKIVHRDIKPPNVLMAEDGTPRLSDFGVAQFGDMARVTQTGDMIGTLAYLSPEGCIGEDLDTRTDIWSFGVMLYELLTGQRPFKENNGSIALLMSILQDPIKPIHELAPDIPPALATLVMRMLDKNRDTRIGSFRLIGAQIEAIMTGQEIPTELDEDTPSTSPKLPAVPKQEAQPAPPTPSATVTPPKTATVNVKPATIPTRTQFTAKRRIEGPPQIYISYVRSDTDLLANQIYRRLVKTFGEKNVFIDLEGEGYIGDVVENAVASCDALLVIIGRGWDNAIHRAATGRYDDTVRLEVETGLSRDNVLVIPVLVDGATIGNDLPDRMHDLVYRSPVVIRDEQDIDSLINTVRNSFDVIPQRRFNPLWLAGIAAVLVMLGLAAFALISNQPPPVEEETVVSPVGTDEYVVLVANLELLGGATEDASRFIVDDLQQKFERESPFSRVRIRAYPEIITTAEQAATAADRNNAPLIIWGNFDGETAELNLQLGSLQPFGEIPYSRESLQNIINARFTMTNVRQQSMAVPVIAAMNALHTADDDMFGLALSLATLGLVDPVSPDVEGNSVAARWHRYLILFLDDTETGIQEVDAAVQLDSRNAILFMGKALGLDRLGRYDEAVENYRTAKRLAPENAVTPLTAIAQNYLFLRNDPTTALPVLNEVLAIKPDTWEALYYRGIVHYLAEDYDAALPDFERVLEIGPETNLVYPFLTGIALREGRLADAQNLINTVREKFPDPTFAEQLLSSAYNVTAENSPLVASLASFGNFTLLQWNNTVRTAESAIEQTANLEYQILDPYLLKGIAYCNLGNYQAAELSYNQLLDAEPDFTIAYLLRADVRLKQGNLAGVLQDTQAIMGSDQADIYAPFIAAYRSGEVNCENFFDADLSQFTATEESP